MLTFAGPYDERQVDRRDPPRAAARGPGLLRPQPGAEHRQGGRAGLRELVPEARVVDRARPDERAAAGAGHDRLLGTPSSTCWSAPRSSRRASTSRPPTRLLIERADLLGLSQLHQLRGRVGRGRERGYAYFLYPPEKPLTETAHDRLSTIAAAQRPGCRHGRGDEGPGDPRRRQPARRRAVRSHRRRRLRPLHPAGRRGGRGVPRPGRRAGARGADRAAGRRAPAHRLRRVRSGCGWRCTSGSPRSVPRPMSRRSRPSSHDRYGDAAAGGAQPDRGGEVPAAAHALTGLTEIVGQGRFIRFGPAHLPESRVLRLQRLYPRSVVKDVGWIGARAAADERHRAGQPLKDTLTCCTGRTGADQDIFAQLLRRTFASQPSRTDPARSLESSSASRPNDPAWFRPSCRKIGRDRPAALSGPSAVVGSPACS